MDTIPIAWGYSRVSTDPQYVSGLSLENQAVECRRYWEYKLKDKGIALGAGEDDPKNFMFGDDRAVSAKIPTLRRPGAIEMDRRLRKGDHIIMPKVDRAWRNMRDAVSALDHWKNMGVHIHFASESICVSADPEWNSSFSVIFVYMMTICAEMERTRMSERMKDCNAAKRARGEHYSGGVPRIGYKWCNTTKSHVERDDEIALLQLILHLIDVQKMSQRNATLLIDKVAKLRNTKFIHIRRVMQLHARAKEMGLSPSVRYWGMVTDSRAAKRIPQTQRDILAAELTASM